MFEIRLSPWNRFRAIKDDSIVRRWLMRVGDETVKHFKSSMKSYPPASAPGAFPNKRSGRLHASVDKKVSSNQVEVGTSMHYSGYLAHGTRKMAKRKMSKEALAETLPKVRGDLKGFARWSR